MNKLLIVRAAATTALALSLAGGMASADISNTGPSSHNAVTSHFSNNQSVRNNNNLGLQNHNQQGANSGNANVKHNTTGGSATSGDASNDNGLNVTATVDNTGTAGNLGGGMSDPSDLGSIDTTGPNSSNTISSTVNNNVRVTNNNNVSVNNSNYQGATSGYANVSDNTTGGDATSGAASNTNSAIVNLTVNN